MPLYEYQCDNCGDVFEVIQKFVDQPLTVHEKCGGGPVHRLISAPAFQFKGSGWYVTDYAKSNSSTANGGDAKPEKSESATTSKSTDKSDSSKSATPSSSTPSTTSSSSSEKK